MAIFNEIEAPRYARMLQKLFGIKGGAPVRQIAGEIAPALVLFSGRENRYLEDWQMFGSRSQTNAVAAQDSVIRLANPLGSGIIAVIESMKLWGSIAVECFIEHAASGNNGNLANIQTPAAFESRRNPPGTGNNGAALVTSFTNNIGQGNHVAFDDIILPATTISNDLVNYDEQEIVILPGADLQFRTNTLNLQLSAMVRWRERVLEDPEKT